MTFKVAEVRLQLNILNTDFCLEILIINLMTVKLQLMDSLIELIYLFFESKQLVNVSIKYNLTF